MTIVYLDFKFLSQLREFLSILYFFVLSKATELFFRKSKLHLSELVVKKKKLQRPTVFKSIQQTKYKYKAYIQHEC